MSSGARSNSDAITASNAGQGFFNALPAAVAWYPWAREMPDRRSARQEEARIKQLPRAQKLALVAETGDRRSEGVHVRHR